MELDALYAKLAALARKYGAQRLVLYGSRARGDNRYNSDIDLAVYGMPKDNQSRFWLDAEDLPTLLKFDIVFIQENMNPAFLANIKRDGVDLMNKLQEKYAQLDQGYTEINSPKAVVRQAFAFGMLEDEKAWVNLLTDRNLTSHVYDEQTAKEIFEHIEHTYLKLFDEVIAYMK